MSRVSVDEFIVVAAEEFPRLQGERMGKALVDALQSSPYRDIELAPASSVTTSARVAVSFKKVAVRSKDAHKRLEEAARDPGKTSKRMFPVL